MQPHWDRPGQKDIVSKDKLNITAHFSSHFVCTLIYLSCILTIFDHSSGIGGCDVFTHFDWAKTVNKVLLAMIAPIIIMHPCSSSVMWENRRHTAHPPSTVSLRLVCTSPRWFGQAGVTHTRPRAHLWISVELMLSVISVRFRAAGWNSIAAPQLFVALRISYCGVFTTGLHVSDSPSSVDDWRLEECV